MNIFKRAWTWLTTKSEETKVTDTTAASTTVEQQTIVDTGTETEIAADTPAAEVKAGVNDFEAALTFVESGVEQLGAAAKDELKALAKKYL